MNLVGSASIRRNIVRSLESEDGRTRRIVFVPETGLPNAPFVVVKLFDSEIASVKVWVGASLERTISSWRTRIAFVPSDVDIERCEDAIDEANLALSSFDI